MSDHDHDHDEFHEPTDSEVRAKAVESLLAEKGLLSTDAVDEIVNQYENDAGPMNGARVVARAWTDLEYKNRLLENGGDAVAELGYGDEHSARLVVVENTPGVHNVIVCTLCSCYPWSVLGLSPGMVQVGDLSLTCGKGTESRPLRVRPRPRRLN